MPPASEYEIHRSIVEWLEGVPPACVGALPDGCEVHHSPNEGKHKVQYRAKLAKLGVKKGWPDLEVFINPSWWSYAGPWSPVFLEVKSAKGRLSQSQKAVAQRLEKLGCHVHTVRSIDEARKALARYVQLRDGF